MKYSQERIWNKILIIPNKASRRQNSDISRAKNGKHKNNTGRKPGIVCWNVSEDMESQISSTLLNAFSMLCGGNWRRKVSSATK